MKRRAGPGALLLSSAKAAAQFTDTHNITVVGFFDVCLSALIYTTILRNPKIYLYQYFYLYQNLESDAAKVFKEVAYDMADTEFAMTATPEVFQKYEIKNNSVVLFKKVRTRTDVLRERQRVQCVLGYQLFCPLAQTQVYSIQQFLFNIQMSSQVQKTFAAVFLL